MAPLWFKSTRLLHPNENVYENPRDRTQRPPTALMPALLAWSGCVLVRLRLFQERTRQLGQSNQRILSRVR